MKPYIARLRLDIDCRDERHSPEILLRAPDLAAAREMVPRLVRGLYRIDQLSGAQAAKIERRFGVGRAR